MLLWPKMQFEAFNRWGSDQGNVCGGPHQHCTIGKAPLKVSDSDLPTLPLILSTLIARTLTHQPTSVQPSATFWEDIWGHSSTPTHHIL